MLTLLCTLVLLFFAFWLLVLLVAGIIVTVAEMWTSLGRGLAWVAQGLAWLYPEYWIPLLLGVGPFVLLAVALVR
jgi:hypothetical protein